MRVDIDGVSVELLGDPHLGKKFVNGVPLHRRGEREATVRGDFEASLEKAREVDLHVCMGDLLDRAVVSYETILWAADAYINAARKPAARNTEFFVLRGNHDKGRDEETVTAFDIFAGLVESRANIIPVYRPGVYDGLALFPWSSGNLEEDVRSANLPEIANYGAAFFHADVDPIAGPDNLIPTKALAELGITRAFTGHVHKPHEFTRDGVHVTVVGSLQPFSFGEEIDDSLYVTMTKEEVLRCLAS